MTVVCGKTVQLAPFQSLAYALTAATMVSRAFQATYDQQYERWLVGYRKSRHAQ